MRAGPGSLWGSPARAARSSLVARAVLAAAALAAVVVLGCPQPAAAHPLGNFTVNRYARVEVSAGFIRVLYVLDEAEIPAFQERAAVVGDPGGFALRRADEMGQSLRLRVDGTPVPLRRQSQVLTQPPGQGGLATLRVAVLFEAPMPGDGPDVRRRAEFQDVNEPQRIGWREIVVAARGNATLYRSDVPSRDLSDELRRYPADLTQSPVDRRAATFEFSSGSVTAPPPPLEAGRAGPARTGGGLAALANRSDLSGTLLLGILALAMGFGAAHALGPGHGKTIMAAYLVGTRGRPRDAIALAGVVSLMHTVSVLVLALVLFRLERSVPGERIYPWLTLVSGVLVMGVGAWLLVTRWRRRRSAHGDHDHGDHDHSGHGHAGHGHRHAPQPEVKPLSRGGIAALGASGGLFPSPSAVVVLVSTFSVGRAGLGLAIVAAFSVGLAVTLAAVGCALALGRGLLERRTSRILAMLPVLGAAILVVAGLVVTLQGANALT